MEIKLKLTQGSMAACCCTGACGNRRALELPCDRCGGLARFIPPTRDVVQCLTATVQSSLGNEMNLYSLTDVTSHTSKGSIYRKHPPPRSPKVAHRSMLMRAVTMAGSL